jgi:hypothetical protein
MFRNILPMSVPSGFQIFIVRKNIGNISRGDLNATEKKTNMDAVAVAGPDVPFLVDLDAIWYARIGIREYTPVSKGLGGWLDIERVAERALVRKQVPVRIGWRATSSRAEFGRRPENRLLLQCPSYIFSMQLTFKRQRQRRLMATLTHKPSFHRQ